MLQLTSSKKYEGEIKTITLKGKAGIGFFEDINGIKWDVYAFYGKSITKSGKNQIHARPVDNNNKYSTVSGINVWEVTYKPYFVEFIN